MVEDEQLNENIKHRMFAELYEIFMHMSKEDREKIPPYLLKIAEENRIIPPPIHGLSEISDHTRSSLAVLYRLFWASPEEKEQRTLTYYRELCVERLQPMKEFSDFAEEVEADIEKLKAANNMAEFRAAAENAGLSDYLKELEEADRMLSSFDS